MLEDNERFVLDHFFYTYPQHLRMQVIIDDAVSPNPSQTYIVNPLYNSLPLPTVMAGACNLLRELEARNA